MKSQKQLCAGEKDADKNGPNLGIRFPLKTFRFDVFCPAFF